MNNMDFNSKDNIDDMRLHLHKIATDNNVLDNTELIRKLKHSEILKKNINDLLKLKAEHNNDIEIVHCYAMNECSFLFTYYTDIYNKVRKDEINLEMLFELIEVLKRVEDGLIDQHDGLLEFGLLFKKICYDSAIRKADKLNMNNNTSQPSVVSSQSNISWKDFKNKHN